MVKGNAGTTAEVGGAVFQAVHTHAKPLEYGSLGHYRTSVRIVGTNTQAANSRLLEIQNGHATNLIIPTLLNITTLQIAVGTVQENFLDCFKCTSFTAVDTTNTVTPVSSVRRTSMAAYPGGANVRHLTLTGNLSGMTGGTLTKDTGPFGKYPYVVSSSINTTRTWPTTNMLENDSFSYPFVFVQNEGYIVENSVLNNTSLGVIWIFDWAWAEVTAF